MRNPMLKRMERSTIGDTGRKSEAAVAKKIGGRLTPASGAMTGAKGDMKFGRFLIEAKATISDSLGLKFDWLGKIAREARNTNKLPALAISFTDEHGKSVMNGDWVAIRMSDFKKLTGGDD